MKTLRAVQNVFVIVLLILVLLPVAIINGVANKRPKFDVLGIGTAVNTWIESNKDFRKYTSRKIRFKLLHMSPSPSLHLGQDGWIFYTLDNNLDIPRGTYPLSQDVLDYQTTAFSNVKKYYELMEADFYFLPYPAKTSIYPEYISGKNLTVGETPVDIVANNLIQRTDVNVIAPKQQLLTDKALGKVYMKMDVHTSDLGGYAVYKVICKELAVHSGLDISPVSVKFVDGEYPIGSNSIASVADLFGESETGPIAQYEAHAWRVTKGDFYEKVKAICESEANKDEMSAWVVFENPEAQNGTLLIYGTSMWLFDNIDDNNGAGWQLTRYLAENFRRVVYVGIHAPITPELDSIVKPNIVIVESAERFSNSAGYFHISRMPN